MQDKKGEEAARKMQKDNATGANQGEQGQASFVTGSTTQGGSDYGQGSSQLGGESYRQGDQSNDGTNYQDEAGKIGNSTVGTNEEGSSSPVAGSDVTGAKSAHTHNGPDAEWNKTSAANEDTDDDRHEELEKRREEGNPKDTDMEDDTYLGQKRNEGRSSGSWSKGTL